MCPLILRVINSALFKFDTPQEIYIKRKKKVARRREGARWAKVFSEIFLRADNFSTSYIYFIFASAATIEIIENSGTFLLLAINIRGGRARARSNGCFLLLCARATAGHTLSLLIYARNWNFM
jgi:hypothetical protein